MFAKKVPVDNTWVYTKIPGGHLYKSEYGSVTIMESPWRVEFRDANEKLLTETVDRRNSGSSFTPVLPFCFVRRAKDYSPSMPAVFSLSPEEKIFGCGESFTEFNKRGKKLFYGQTTPTGCRMKPCISRYLFL